MSRTKPYSRTIPHPLFERLIVEDAMNEEKDSWKPERPHEYGYFPGCVDFMDVEVKFTHLNKGDADHASIAAASIKLLNYADIEESLDMKASQVKVYLHRARRKLRADPQLRLRFEEINSSGDDAV